MRMADTRPEAWRWLIGATSGSEWENIVGALALARQIKARARNSEILFFTDSEASTLTWREGFACVKVPSAEAIMRGDIDAIVADLLGRTIAASVYAAFRPHVVVADTFPLGRGNELTPLLASWAYRVLIHRNVSLKAVQRPEIQDALRRYHLILVSHRAGQAAAPFPPEVPVREIGDMLIRSREEGLPQAEARRRLGLPAEGFCVFLNFGAAGDGNYKAFFERVVAKAQTMRGWTLVWPVPPFLRTPGDWIGDGRVHAVRYFPLGEVWQAFDGAITLMGANTMAQLMHNGIPTVFLPPREGMAEDQHARADRVAQHGPGWLLQRFDDAELAGAFAH